MPLRISISGKPVNIEATTRFTTIDTGVGNASMTIDPDYYVGSENMTGK